MIDKQLIDSAKTIRKEYLNLVNSLDKYQVDIKNLGLFFLKKVQELTEYNENVVGKIKNKDDISKVTAHILAEINEIELEERKISSKVENINKTLEKLKKDEEVLYQTIIKRYPNLTEDQIVKEIRSHL